MELTNYSKFFKSLDKSDPFEIRRKLDKKLFKIRNHDSISLQKRKTTLIVSFLKLRKNNYLL